MNNSKRIHVVAIAALGVLVVALAIGVIAQQLAASRLSNGIQAQKQLLLKSRGELKDRAKWRDDYGDLALKLGGRMSTCSWSDQMPFMVAQVSGIVQANGLKIENLQPEPMTASSNIERFPMRIVVQTDLKNLTKLLKDMSTAVPLIDVERLEVRNAQGESDKLQVNMTVSSFVVLDKNSRVTRRRAVVPAKTAAVESKSADKAVAKPADQPSKPAPQPSVKAPTAVSSAGPSQRPNGSARRTGPPRNGNGDKPAGDRIQAGGTAMPVSPGAGPSKAGSPVPEPVPEGGRK